MLIKGLIKSVLKVNYGVCASFILFAVMRDDTQELSKALTSTIELNEDV